MDKSIDCIVVGSCVVDVLCRPVSLSEPIGGGRLIESDPLRLTTGGIVSNAGIAMARLGMRVAAFTFLGDDEWADVIRSQYAAEGIDTSALTTYPGGATSTTAVLIDASGERSFVHCVGAPRRLDKQALMSRLDLFAKARATLFGYYPLMTNLQNDLPEVFAAIRETGCLTAIDAAGDGGTMDPLASISTFPANTRRSIKRAKPIHEKSSRRIATWAQKASWASSSACAARCSVPSPANSWTSPWCPPQALSSTLPALATASLAVSSLASFGASPLPTPANWPPPPVPAALPAWAAPPPFAVMMKPPG
jgi:hypothetical protein